MKKLLLFLIIFITACSNTDEPVIQKVERVNNTELNTEPELIEEVTGDDVETIEYIDFIVDDEVVRVNLQAIPILDNYLMGQADKKTVVEKMKLVKLPIDEQTIFLLEFSCQNDLCSYLLINPNEENQSHLLTDLAKYEETILSPDQLKFVIQFSRTSSNFSLNHLIAINAETFEILSLKNQTNDENVLHYKWPFVTVEWIDDSNISVTKHNLIDYGENENIISAETQNDSTTTIFTLE